MRVDKFKVMDEDKVVDEGSLDVEKKARKLAEERNIPYREALIQLSGDKQAAKQFSAFDPEIIKATRKKIQGKLDSFDEDVEKYALDKGLSFGSALRHIAQELAIEAEESYKP